MLKNTNWLVSCCLLSYLLWQAGGLGLSDDEAYYWVLAQSPAWGYAFHPPAVAWLIAGVQWLIPASIQQWICAFGLETLIVRLPAILSTMCIFWMGFSVAQKMGTLSNQVTFQTLPQKQFRKQSQKQSRIAWVLASFSGFFAFSWMIVPDIPLFLGWMFLFVATYDSCFAPKPKAYTPLLLVTGAALSLLAKYSGILTLISAGGALLYWSPNRSPKRTRRMMSFLILGALLGLIPTLLWNSQHQWASILYQLRDRHSDLGWSWTRYLRFWGIQLLVISPIGLGATFWIFQKALQYKKTRELKPDETRARRQAQWFCLWAFPPLVIFCTQPLFSAFKPHWAFIAWWPIFLALALESQGPAWKWIRYQTAYGCLWLGLIGIGCHFPLGAWMAQLQSQAWDPRWDVSNDFYGWALLPKWLNAQLSSEEKSFVVVGSRYQTASQAAFVLRGQHLTTFLPRSLKEQDEWKNLSVSDSEGPHWPALKKSILYVRNQRYDALPEFKQSTCSLKGRLQPLRFGVPAQWVEVWRCDPQNPT